MVSNYTGFNKTNIYLSLRTT